MAEEKEKNRDEKIKEEFVKKYDYIPGESKQLYDHLSALKDVFRTIGGSGYYSDAIVKKIAKIGIDYTEVSLKVEKLRALASKIYTVAEKQTIKGEQVNIEKREMDELKKGLKDLEKEVERLYNEALKLIEEINKSQ